MENTNKKKFNFGWKEVLLALILAAIVVIFVIVFVGNKSTVEFVSVGGHFDEGDSPNIYDYENYIVGTTDANMNNYHQIVKKTFRISAAASLPEAAREGYDFEGWYFADVDENGNIVYSNVEFTEKSVKNLEKDQTVRVYAKWTPSPDREDVSTKDSVLAALDITWKGMLGIFIVVGLIYLCIILLNAITNGKFKNLKDKLSKKKDKTEDTEIVEAGETTDVDTVAETVETAESTDSVESSEVADTESSQEVGEPEKTEEAIKEEKEQK